LTEDDDDDNSWATDNMMISHCRSVVECSLCMQLVWCSIPDRSSVFPLFLHCVLGSFLYF
jgi:hypothetical protein